MYSHVWILTCFSAPNESDLLKQITMHSNINGFTDYGDDRTGNSVKKDDDRSWTTGNFTNTKKKRHYDIFFPVSPWGVHTVNK